MQFVACGSRAYLPATHATQALSFSYVPGWQAWHALAEDAPVVGFIVPAGHGRHSVWSLAYSLSRYVWTGHSRQTLEPTDAYLPSGQIVHTLAPPAENVPFGQVEQAVALTPEYSPLPHATHVRFSSYVPALQAPHANREYIPTYGRTVPRGHAWQSRIDPLPDSSRYVWNGQGVQAVLPTAAMYPCRHAMQSCCAWLPEYVPFPHGWHVWAPYVLAGYEKVPALHQSHCVTLPVRFEADPREHGWQSSSPVSKQ